MKNKVLILILVIISFSSCREKKIEIIQSKVYSNIFLLKNPPKEDSLVENLIKDFLLKNPLDNSEFYFYTKNGDPLHKGTSYFIENKEDPGGFSSEELSNYQDEDGIASFGFVNCKQNSTKKVGIIRYYNSKVHDFYKPDTIIGKCK